MEIKPLYKYEREKGKFTVSLEKPDCEYTELYRITASEGKLVTLDGENAYVCIDTEIKDGWYEIDNVSNEKTLEERVTELEDCMDALLGVSEDE